MSIQSIKRTRPTIGILAGWSPYEGAEPDNYLATILAGIQSAALIRQCHLLIGWGVARASKTSIYPAWPELSLLSDFVPVGPWNTDGLIVFTPLREEQRSLYLQRLMADGYPVLFIATGEEGPTISVNNKEGIFQAMAHLASHGHRRVAFIAGTPTDQGDSKTRLNAYHAAVTEYGLEADPRLVAWGWHRVDGGHKAMREVLDSQVKATAVLASNDNSAIGAMRAIREAGLKTPGDIAVIGFDDQPDAMAQIPPLASVRVPLAVVGEQALVSMLEHVTQGAPLESIQIPTRLITRQSCGCMPDVISSAVAGVSPRKPVLLDQFQGGVLSEQENMQQLANEMLIVLPSELRFPSGEKIRLICTTLVEAFFTSLKHNNSAYFNTAFMEAIRDLEDVGGPVSVPWQEMISVLRREMFRLPLKWGQIKTRSLADDLLHQARAAVSESAQRQDCRHKYQRDIAAQALSEFTAKLSAVLNERQVAELINSDLAETGVRHVRVAFFEPEQNDPVAWSVLLNTDGKQSRQRFASREFPPLGLYPPGELLNLAVLPLVFQSEALGYVVFDASDLWPCVVIARQLAATIKACRLHEQVVELSLTDALTGLHNRRSFEMFLKNEVNRSRQFFRALAIVLVDVDNFKEYNDTYGHPAGDEALQQVARCLSSGRRGSDIVARIGGDEFVMILPETELKGALELCRIIRAMLMVLSDLKRPISVSMGLTASRNAGMNGEALVRQADMALYESKRKGRNRISVFQNEQALDEKDILLLE